MRTLKFRGKKTDNNEWVYGYYYYKWRIVQHVIHCSESEGVLVDKEFEVIGKTVGEFTESQDKNGKDIYEGDILNTKTTFRNNMADRRFQKNTIIEVGFKDGCFIDKNTDVNLFDKIHSPVSHKIDFEIIGNIHENPELIK